MASQPKDEAYAPGSVQATEAWNKKVIPILLEDIAKRIQEEVKDYAALEAATREKYFQYLADVDTDKYQAFIQKLFEKVVPDVSVSLPSDADEKLQKLTDRVVALEESIKTICEYIEKNKTAINTFQDKLESTISTANASLAEKIKSSDVVLMAPSDPNNPNSPLQAISAERQQAVIDVITATPTPQEAAIKKEVVANAMMAQLNVISPDLAQLQQENPAIYKAVAIDVEQNVIRKGFLANAFKILAAQSGSDDAKALLRIARHEKWVENRYIPSAPTDKPTSTALVDNLVGLKTNTELLGKATAALDSTKELLQQHNDQHRPTRPGG